MRSPPNKPLKLSAAGLVALSTALNTRRGRTARGRGLAAIRWAAARGIVLLAQQGRAIPSLEWPSVSSPTSRLFSTSHSWHSCSPAAYLLRGGHGLPGFIFRRRPGGHGSFRRLGLPPHVFRELAACTGGGATYTSSFVEQYLLPLLYPASLSRELQYALGPSFSWSTGSCTPPFFGGALARSRLRPLPSQRLQLPAAVGAVRGCLPAGRPGLTITLGNRGRR